MRAMIVAVGSALVMAGVGVQPEPPRLRLPGRPEQPAPANDGPGRHQIHFLTSDDGLTFTETTEPVMKRASVPDIIELARDLPKAGSGAKGDLCIYTVDAREGRPECLSRLVSKDGGKTWGRPESLTVATGDGGERRAVDPSVVQLPDGRLRLYFYSMARGAGPSPEPEDPRGPGELPPPIRLPGRDPGDWRPPPSRPDRPDPGINSPPRRPEEAGGKHGIYSAVSVDGVRFTLEDGVRFEEEGITDPEVVRAGEEWLMFVSRGQEVILARSDEGLEWKKDKSFVLRGGGVPGAVVLGDGRVRVYQSSPEGITSVAYEPRSGMFKPEGGVRVKGPCADPAVWARAGGGYVAVVKRWMEAGPKKRPL